MTLCGEAQPVPDGCFRFCKHFLSVAEADRIFETLKRDVEWHQPAIRLFGKTVRSPRLAAWYGDPGAVYRYSGTLNRPLPWLPVLEQLKDRLQSMDNRVFNSVLLNLYRNGHDAMGWHADDESGLGPEPVIASISLGAIRRFRMRHRSDRSLEPISLDLGHGSLLIMSGTTQQYWKHAVPRTSKPVGVRINLTFRWINPVRRSGQDAIAGA